MSGPRRAVPHVSVPVEERRCRRRGRLTRQQQQPVVVVGLLARKFSLLLGVVTSSAWVRRCLAYAVWAYRGDRDDKLVLPASCGASASPVSDHHGCTMTQVKGMRQEIHGDPFDSSLNWCSTVRGNQERVLRPSQQPAGVRSGMGLLAGIQPPLRLSPAFLLFCPVPFRRSSPQGLRTRLLPATAGPCGWGGMYR